MNVLAPVRAPTPVKLTADGFWLLKQAGAFAGYRKAELWDGALSGIPIEADDEPESAAMVPIKLRLEDYRLLDDKGLLADHGKTELIDGLVCAMSPQYRPHGYVKDELAYRLRRALEALHSNLHVATEQSVAIPPHDEPQPDIVLTSEPRGLGPIPVGSVTLAVEIAANSLGLDLGDKAALYARAGIAEYWVVDVVARAIRQMSSPSGDLYSTDLDIAFDTPITSTTVPGLSVETTGL